MSIRIDFDHNATTPVDPRVVAAMAEALATLPGNPSSVHAEGRRARHAVELARAAVGRLIGGAPAGVVFTSGGSEADVLGVVGAARASQHKAKRIVASPLEHPAVLGALRVLAREGFEIVFVPVDAAGRIDPDDVQRLLPGAALACFALANHELGNLYDVAAFVRGSGVPLLVDAVQAAGKVPIDVEALGADLLALSAHKLHGPKGVGALWIRPGLQIDALVPGGQERGRRAGTENVPGVVGFGVAARLATERVDVSPLRDRLEAGCVALGARVNGSTTRVGNTLNVAWEGVSGELLVAALDLEGISVSAGAACTSGSPEPSPVLLALGQSRERAGEGVRFSLGRASTEAEVNHVLALLPRLVERVRAAGPG